MSGKKKPWLPIVIAAVLSWFGVSKILQITKDYSAHQQAITDVQAIVNENSNINSIPNLDALKANQTKIQQTIEQLKIVPNLPGYPYQNAQNQISQLNQLLAKLDSKIQVEEAAFNNLQAALKLDEEAAILVQEKAYSNNWQEAKGKWQQAISILEKIPTATYVSDTAKLGILSVKRNFNDVDKVITSEQKSLQNFSSAVELAQKATNLTKDTTLITLPELLNAKLQWQQAINLLANVSSATNLSLKAQSQLSIYRNNYRQVSNAIDEIKKCLTQKTSFESECTANISLYISPPETLTALLEDIKKEEDANNQIASSEFNSTSGTSSDTSDESSSSNYSGYSGGYSSGYRSHSGSVSVNGYTRRDGTYVNSHTRSAPGSRVSGFGSFRSGGASS
ncbi:MULTISPECIES: hypothetical protein [Nostoc]|uniref:Uncharacterized protein n=2 Tax=Nostoc TaxID=1177 RepID=A0ABR8IEV0_9NOSO|nr:MULTISPECIES: hypothetical protein [Nostoc]MBD2564524.1 hypothetical protein [Nostoc linckia FACHB-391]MBD2650079.1 hypothetical protein [Nostoc foliaceum FACHB-393]